MKLKVLLLLFLSLCLCYSDARKLKSRRTSWGDKPLLCTTLKLIDPKTGEKMLSSQIKYDSEEKMLIFCSDITIKGTVDVSDLIQSLKKETFAKPDLTHGLDEEIVDEPGITQSLKKETVAEPDLTHGLKEEKIYPTDLTQSPKKPANIFGFHHTSYPNFFYDTDTNIEYLVKKNVWSISFDIRVIKINVIRKGLFYRIAYDIFFFLNKLMLSKNGKSETFTKQQVRSLGKNYKNYVKSLSDLKRLIKYVKKYVN
jgi:hypothetical protein